MKRPLRAGAVVAAGLVAAIAPPGHGLAATGRLAPTTATSAEGGSTARQVARGRRLYREGVRGDGSPLRATLLGDVAVEGTQFSCLSCHRRSGMGAGEGALVVPSVAGPDLFVARDQRGRPRYTEATLARALREGVDAAGRRLDPIMPRYALSDADLADLIAYLRQLSAVTSPGVSDSVVHLASVFTTQEPAEQRDAVWAVIQAYFADRNAETRAESERAAAHAAWVDNRNRAWRTWSIDRWLLEGPPETWRQQLEEHYRRRPVFALVSGLAESGWQPMEDFCEGYRVPCLLPGTSLPGESRADGAQDYTFYFSRGMALEADLAALHLSRAPAPRRLLQIVGAGLREQSAARVLESRLTEAGWDVETRSLGQANAATAIATDRPTTLWLTTPDLARLAPPSLAPGPLVYLSATLLGNDLANVPASLAERGALIEPYRPPGTRDPARARFAAWLRQHRLDVRPGLREAEAFFACMLTMDGLTHVRDRFVGEYLIDIVEHAESATVFLPAYARSSFGPGQRHLAKGGYLVPLRPGAEPEWLQP